MKKKKQVTESYAETILNSLPDAVFAVNPDLEIIAFNKAAEMIFGVGRNKALGRKCEDVLCCAGACTIKELTDTKKTIVDKLMKFVDSKGRPKQVFVSASLLCDNEGKVIGGVHTLKELNVVPHPIKSTAENGSEKTIVTTNLPMQEIIRKLPWIAGSPSSVLLAGETGTGKELFARAIHNLSHRKAKPFIAVNCAALPDTLLESELFGYKTGAFTGAVKDKPGRFQLAQGGTIFLDEIGDMSPSTQARLTRVLQEREYEPLGDVKTVKTDARVITATNKNLGNLVKEGTFRQDLFYRVNVVMIELPPLRERMDDLPALTAYFIEKFNARQNRTVNSIGKDALACLSSHDFPGNVRELENIIEHAVLLCPEHTIKLKHLPQTLHRPSFGSNTANADISKNTSSLKELEAVFLMDALQRNKWNRLATAKELGIHKATLFRKIKALELNPPKAKRSRPGTIE